MCKITWSQWCQCQAWGNYQAFPTRAVPCSKSVQCVSVWQRELLPLSHWQPPGCLAEKKKGSKAIHVGVLSGFWRLADKGSGDVLRQPLYTGNSQPRTIKLSSAPTLQVVTGWKSFSHAQSCQQQERVATDAFTRFSVRRRDGTSRWFWATSCLNQNKRMMGELKKHLSVEAHATYFRGAKRSKIFSRESQQEVKIKTEFQQNRLKTPHHFALWFGASAER